MRPYMPELPPKECNMFQTQRRFSMGVGRCRSRRFHTGKTSVKRSSRIMRSCGRKQRVSLHISFRGLSTTGLFHVALWRAICLLIYISCRDICLFTYIIYRALNYRALSYGSLASRLRSCGGGPAGTRELLLHVLLQLICLEQAALLRRRPRWHT